MQGEGGRGLANLLGIHIGGHEATLAGERLLWRQALHVGALQQMLEILVQIGEASVHSDLVLPLKVLPHLTEFGVCAAGRDDVIHDVNVDGVQHHNIGVQRGVVNCRGGKVIKRIQVDSSFPVEHTHLYCQR